VQNVYKLVSNPCVENNGGCHKEATCTNDGGKASCTCKSGFEGDGTNCVASGGNDTKDESDDGKDNSGDSKDNSGGDSKDDSKTGTDGNSGTKTNDASGTKATETTGSPDNNGTFHYNVILLGSLLAFSLF